MVNFPIDIQEVKDFDKVIGRARNNIFAVRGDFH